MNQTQETVARLLDGARKGEGGAVDELFAILYDELKELARRQRWRWRGDYTLNTTALVHEGYLKLVGQAQVGVEAGEDEAGRKRRGLEPEHDVIHPVTFCRPAREPSRAAGRCSPSARCWRRRRRRPRPMAA